MQDFLLALVLTATGAGIAWILAAGLPFIGIDDAAITRSYAENIANGVGYVYNLGGERVEGATAILWVGILSVLYSVTATPEVSIIAVCAVFAAVAVFLVLRLTRMICAQLEFESRPAIMILAVFLLASPGYFMWSVWTMMEVSLWSMLLIWMVLLLAQMTEATERPPSAIGICLVALLLPLARPEGIMIAIGLIALAGLLAPHSWRVTVAAGACAIGSFVAVTAFRLSYFGQPFPNTFYAKVSSDRLQDIKDGAKYLVDFLLGSPFAEVFVALWLGAAVWALLGLFRATPGARAILLMAAAALGTLCVYAALGGDHFALWRFYQPVLPLLLVILSITGALVAHAVKGIKHTRRARADHFAILTVMVSVVFIGWMHYYQTRFDVRKEFRLVERGVDFGTFLNGITPRPSIGVGPAGGIALAYDGQILDLLGLNWTEMAHANPVKVGMRNHASFDAATFWKHAPDVVSAFNRACNPGEPLRFWETDDAGFGGLFSDPEFRQSYVPISFQNGTDCWPGFAKPAWIMKLTDPIGVDVFDWTDVTVLR